MKIYTIGPDYYLNGNFDRIPAGQYVLWDDYLAAEARAVKAEQALEESRKATAYFSNVGGIEQNKVDELQAQVDALTKEVESLTKSLDANWVMHQRVVAAEASAAQANARAKVEADEGNKLARLVVDLQAKVDALTKRSEVVERMALAPGMKTNLALQADLAAATARCERYLTLLKSVNDFGYDRRFPIARHIREAIAEQALAENKETK